MSKYEPLSRHLRGLDNIIWRANFIDIERIIGFPLPRSAREYPAWWANDVREGRQSSAWLNEGWRTGELDLGAERIVFRRVENQAVPNAPEITAPSTCQTVEAPAADLLEIRLEMAWRPLGRIRLDQQGKLTFPATDKIPAIYRFALTLASVQQQYIGETENLARRLQHYRTPGPSQQTNIRINEVFQAALAAQAHIDIFIITANDAWIESNGERRPADLSSKAVRRLLENAAIINLDDGVEILNAPK